MAYTLDSTTIKSPNKLTESNDNVSQISLSLGNSRYKDITGENKRTWILSYSLLSKADFETIFNIYEEHIDDGEAKTFVVNEDNLTINTTVNIEIGSRNFMRGGSYLSSMDLILTEV